MLPTNNSSIILLLLSRPRVRNDRRGAQGERPHLSDSPKSDGGASAAFTLLFLLTTLSLVHPTLCNSASILILLTPARNSARFLAPPPISPPPDDGNNDANNQRSINTTMDSSAEDNRPRATQSTLLSSLLPRTGGGGEGRRTQHPVAPGIVQPLSQVPPYGYLSLAAAAGGGVAPSGSCRAWRQRRKWR
jgi:hypothetical protein